MDPETRASIVAGQNEEVRKSVATIFSIAEQTTTKGVLLALARLPLEVTRQSVGGLGVQEARTYRYRGDLIARVYGARASASARSEQKHSVSVDSALEEVHTRQRFTDDPIPEFPSDAHEVPSGHPAALDATVIEGAVVGLIALEQTLEQMLSHEASAQADFEAWLGSQVAVNRIDQRDIANTLFFVGTAYSVGEDCLAQGLAATSGLVMAIGQAVQSQGALNRYLAAGTGASLTAVGLSAWTAAAYVGAAVGAYFVYHAAKCRFDRKNASTSQPVVRFDAVGVDGPVLCRSA
jgi:hypothetical protein